VVDDVFGVIIMPGDDSLQQPVDDGSPDVVSKDDG